MRATTGIKELDEILNQLTKFEAVKYAYIQNNDGKILSDIGTEINDYKILRLNEGQGIHSIFHPTQTDFHSYWEQILSAPYFNSAPVDQDQISRIAILGLAGGTSANQIRVAYPQTIVDGFEIDKEIIKVGFNYFGLKDDLLNIMKIQPLP